MKKWSLLFLMLSFLMWPKSASAQSLTGGAVSTVMTASERIDQIGMTWPDTNMGAVELSGVDYVLAANGSTGITMVDVANLNSWPGNVSVVDTTLNISEGGSGSFDQNYIGGGPTYYDPGSGYLITMYHGEQWFGGSGSPFYGALGLAYSSDLGVQWHKLGEVISPQTAWGSDCQVDPGAGTLVPNGDYLYAYYVDEQTGCDGSNFNIAVARAPTASVIAAAEAGTPFTSGPGTLFMKWTGGNTWTGDGVTDLANPQDGGGAFTAFFSTNTYYTPNVAYDSYANEYVMVYSNGFADIEARLSPDGLVWGPETTLVSGGGDPPLGIYYPTLLNTAGGNPTTLGENFYVYYVNPFGNWDNTELDRVGVSISSPGLWSGILQSTYGTNPCTVAPSATPAGCAIDWSTVGVTYDGGIPARTTIYQTILASACSDGSVDCASTIQTALNSCPSGDAVGLGVGTFLIDSSLAMVSNCTLRGEGANMTILQCHSTSLTCVNFGPSSFYVQYDTNTAISSGATAGSTSIVVASATGISAGMLAVVEDENDSWVTIIGGPGGGTCTFCGLYSSAMDQVVDSRARGQVVKITNVSGTTLTIDPPLYTNYSLSPQIHPYNVQVSMAGLEDLQIVANNTTSNNGSTAQSMIGFFGADHSWAEGVEDNYADGNHVDNSFSFHTEIRDSYFSGGYLHTSGSTDDAVVMDNFSTEWLVENNIMERMHVGAMVRLSAGGGVFGFNFLVSMFDSGSDGNFSTSAYDAHAAWPQFILYEGNVGGPFTGDSTWGGSSHTTLDRNWLVGTDAVCNSIAAGRQTVNCTPFGWNDGMTNQGWYAFQASRAETEDYPVLYYDSINDVIGSHQQQTLVSYSATDTLTQVGSITWFSGVNRSYDADAYGYSFGFSGSADTGTWDLDSAAPAQTILIQGDYNNITSAVTYTLGVSQNFPASFYRSSGTPSWWPSGTPYPAIGSDVSGGAGPGGHVYSLTASNGAMNCFFNIMDGTDGSAGSPLSTFNAATCYASTPPPPVAGKAFWGGKSFVGGKATIQ